MLCWWSFYFDLSHCVIFCIESIQKPLEDEVGMCVNEDEERFMMILLANMANIVLFFFLAFYCIFSSFLHCIVVSFFKI